VLVDEEDRRYFKQQEIILWRKGEKTRKPFQASLQQQYKQMQNPNVQFASSDQSIGSGKNPLGNLNSESGEVSSSNYRNNKSPLEQESSSEQPTPDKEFQSVINSTAPTISSPTSPVKEDFKDNQINPTSQGDTILKAEDVLDQNEDEEKENAIRDSPSPSATTTTLSPADEPPETPQEEEKEVSKAHPAT